MVTKSPNPNMFGRGGEEFDLDQAEQELGRF
jgi:hypothetical protein